MASRTLRTLLERRLVVSKRGGQGVNRVNHEMLFALTQTGVEEVRRLGVQMANDKVHARDYIRHAHMHRTVCNSVYAALAGTRRWSELQVRSGESPVPKFDYLVKEQKLCKIPDLVMADGAGFEWIEVENSWRNEADLIKVVDCMRVMFLEPDSITRMHFVVTAVGARHIGQRLKKRLTHTDFSFHPRIRSVDALILARHLRISELNLNTLELTDLPL